MSSTKSKPIPGYYWYTPLDERREPEVVHIDRALNVFSCGNDCDTNFQDMDGMFNGPLHPPDCRCGTRKHPQFDPNCSLHRGVIHDR